MELCTAHSFVVVGHILSDLHCRVDAGGLVGLNDERAGATQHLCAPLLQNFNWRSGFDARGNRRHN
ncbi:MAG: hypothetical protein ACKPKO_37195, partial [Candidatus Fonsibacter sp.]